MTIERQLEDYGRHLQKIIANLEVPMRPAHAVRPLTPRMPARRWRWVVTAAALAAFLAIMLVVLVRFGNDTESAPFVDEGPPTPTSSDPVTPASVPVFEGSAVLAESAPLQLRVVTMARSGGTLWAWDQQGRVGGYRDGVWWSLPQLPGRVLDVAGTQGRTVWAIIEDPGSSLSSLWYLEDEAWEWLDPELDLSIVLTDDPPPRFQRGEDADWGERITFEPHGVEVDERTGIVWVAGGDHLYRWDGENMTNVGNPPDQLVMDIAVSGDGTVWAFGFNLFAPHDYGLARYRDDASAWEMVHPRGGNENVPTAALAPTSNGDLWVLLTDRTEYRDKEPGENAIGLDPPWTWAVAYLDSTTDQWTLYQDGPPGATPGAIAGADNALWLIKGRHLWIAEDVRGVVRFDRQTWTTYLEDRSIEALGIGDDGTVWVSWEGLADGVHRLAFDTEPGS